MLSNVIRLSRILIYIFSIILLISSIKTKNRKILKNNFIISSFLIFYLFMAIFILPGFAEIEQGWDFLIILPIAVIDFIILIINIVVSRKKLKNNELKDEDNKLIKFYFVILLIVPIALVGISFLYEIAILNNSDLIITFNYQNGIIISEDTRFGIGDKFCRKISISEKFIEKPVLYNEYYSYNIEYNKVKEGYSISSYNDPELNNIDTVIAEKIFRDIEIDNNEQNRHHASLRRIIGSDYYIISHYIYVNENQSLATTLAEYVYKGITRIGNINCHGSIETVHVYSH